MSYKESSMLEWERANDKLLTPPGLLKLGFGHCELSLGYLEGICAWAVGQLVYEAGGRDGEAEEQARINSRS